jgi:hypothetical protein
MQWLNKELLRYNQANGGPNVPHVHKYGGREDKLHLDDERRMMIGRMVSKYFRFNTN